MEKSLLGNGGFFELELDPNGTQVKLEYVFKISDDAVQSLNNERLRITNVTYKIGESGVSQTADLPDGTFIVRPSPESILAGEKCYVHVNVGWNFGTEEDAPEDKATARNRTIVIPIIVTARQTIGSSGN